MVIRFIVLIIFFSFYQILSAQDISKHQWHHRLVLLISTQPDYTVAKEQMDALLSDLEGLGERKIKIYEVVANRYRFISPTDLKTDSEWFNADSLSVKYARDDVPFEIILIGLDGGVKLRQDNFVKTEDLFSLIDGMPMRRAEMGRH